MSDIERVSVSLWRNPDVVNRVPAGSVPIGDYDIEEIVGGRRDGVEAFVEGSEPYVFWGDTDVLPAKVAAKAKPKRAASSKTRKAAD